MTIGFLFWLLMVLSFLFGSFSYWPKETNTPGAFRPFGVNILLFVLLFLLGWKTFGFVIQG